MNDLNNVSAMRLAVQNGSPLVKEYNEQGFQIGRVAKMALHVLTVSCAVVTVACVFTACFITALEIIPVVVVSAVALSILCAAEVLPAFKPYIKGQSLSAFNLVRATTIDILAKLACAFLFPFSQTFFDPKKSEEVGEQTPTLLCHGYLHNSSAWIYFRYRMKLAGRKNVFTIDLGNPFLSIEEYAKKIDKKVKEIRKLTGREDIHFIGHSMGGVVCSYYATHMAESAGNVKSIITLGSPLNGTRVRGLGKGAQQMRYQSEFITSLRNKMINSDIPFYHVGSKSDMIIRPASSTVIKKNKFTMFENLGHVSYIFSDKVIRHCLFFNKQIETAR